MAYQFRIAAGIEQLAARLTAPLHSAWRGRPGSEARRALGKIGFWIAQPGLDAACQRQLVALQRSRQEVADVATAAKRVELQIAELERRADEMAVKTTPASSSPSCVASTRTCRTARSGLLRSAGG
jgi:hypothetical protein